MVKNGCGFKSKRSPSSSPKEYRCGICDRIFDSTETLNSHKRMDHGEEGRQISAGVGLVVVYYTPLTINMTTNV